MALRLRIVSQHAARLGENVAKVFGVHGGSIGRSPDNEWILPDPERYLSGKHARVDFRTGRYVLLDTSSNGTYINGAQVPLGKFHDYTLQDGDRIRLGEYEVLVSIDKTDEAPPGRDAVAAPDGGGAALKKSTANDLGAELDLSDLFESGGSLDQGSGLRPRNAFGQSLQPGGELPLAQPPGNPDPSWHMLTRPLKLARNAPAPRAAPAQMPTLYDGDLESGLAAFCRGAGIDARALTPEARAGALQLAGQLLREAVLGLVELNQGRIEFRNRFRLAAPAAAPESPLRLTQGVDETLLRLLTTQSLRAGSVDAVRGTFRDLKAQNAATLAAMQAALEEYLSRFDPKELEERFERGAKRGVFGAANKGRYWELYAELFAGLSQRPVDGLPHLFVEAFAKAYEARLRLLTPPRRGLGGDQTETSDPELKPIGDP